MLLGIYTLALVATPALLNQAPAIANERVTTHEDFTTLLPAVTITTDPATTTPVFDILLWVYVAGVLICALMTAAQLLSIFRLMRNSSRQNIAGLTVYVHNLPDIAPFSLGNVVVANASDVENRAIMAHEGAHIARRHTLDLCIAQLAVTLCWYCPAAWLLRRELKLVHEFQADEAVISNGADTHTYCRLLVERAARLRISTISSNLNHKNLKQRIRMMQTPHSKRPRGLMRVLLPLASIACATMFLSAPAVSSTIGQISRSSLSSYDSDMAVKNKKATFVVYGIDLNSDAVKNGNFALVSDVENKGVSIHAVDGVISPRIGAIFCTDKKVLERITPKIRKYVVDNKVMSAKEFSGIPASELCKVVVSGNSMTVYTRNQIESQFFDALEDAVRAENQ